MNIKYLQIADFVFCLNSQNEKLNLNISENYLPYQISTSNEVDYHIKVIKGIPDKLLDSIEIFKAKHNGSESDSPYFWSVNKQDEKIVLFTSDPGNNTFPFFALVFSKNEINWKLYINKNAIKNSNSIDPFLYPMGPLIMYYCSAFNNAVMIHGSGLNYNSKGYLFSGVSGVGKSTMANIWKNAGAKIINDDRLIIREKAGIYYLYNTPMYYPDLPKKVELGKIFLIKHGKNNSAQKLTKLKAITGVMANCIHHGYDEDIINSLLLTLENICNKIPVYNLSFLPNKSVVNYINTL